MAPPTAPLAVLAPSGVANVDTDYPSGVTASSGCGPTGGERRPYRRTAGRPPSRGAAPRRNGPPAAGGDAPPQPIFDAPRRSSAGQHGLGQGGVGSGAERRGARGGRVLSDIRRPFLPLQRSTGPSTPNAAYFHKVKAGRLNYSAFSLQENRLQGNMGRESPIPVSVGHFYSY